MDITVINETDYVTDSRAVINQNFANIKTEVAEIKNAATKVSYDAETTSGQKVGTLTIDGTTYDLYAPNVTVDSALSDTSTNPVENKAVSVALGTKANTADLAAVATSGSYTDLTDKPTIPTIDSAMSSTSTNAVQNKVVNDALAGKSDSGHTHSYLPLSGGTLSSGAILSWADAGHFNAGFTAYPYVAGGFSFTGESDGVSIKAVETAKDNLELQIQLTDDNSNSIAVLSSGGTTVARINASGQIIGSSLYTTNNRIYFTNASNYIYIG